MCFVLYFYVIDNERRLQGVVPTRRLLTCDPQAPVPSVMKCRVDGQIGIIGVPFREHARCDHAPLSATEVFARLFRSQPAEFIRHHPITQSTALVVQDRSTRD